MNAVKANQRPETDGKHKLLILTNINVSNAHLMIAKILKQYSAHTVKFLNVRTPTSFWDNAEWYGFDKEDFDISTYFSGKNLPGKIFMFIKTILKSDVIFCTGEISFFVRLFNKPYIYWCIGADLDQYSKYGCSSFALNNAKERLYRKGIRLIKKFLYRNGIKRASMTVIAPYQFNDICALGYKKLAAFPHTLEGEYLESNLDVRKKNCEELRKRYGCKWIFFSATRHVWSQSFINESDYKGNDVIIRSFYHFIQQTKEEDSKLFLIEKGNCVSESKKLIKELGLEQYVVWLEPMNRKGLREYYSGAHISFDQFSQGCLALCAVESLACGSPTVSYIGPSVKEVPFYKIEPPILNSKNPIVIADFMKEIIENEEYRRKIEKQSLDWTKQNCSYGKLVEAFDSMINSVW